MCPSSSWQQSLLGWRRRGGQYKVSLTQEGHKGETTHGSGECIGADEWRTYCVHWNTLKAKLLRKSLADNRPAIGRSWKPVFSGWNRNIRYPLRGSSSLFRHLQRSPAGPNLWIRRNIYCLCDPDKSVWRQKLSLEAFEIRNRVSRWLRARRVKSCSTAQVRAWNAVGCRARVTFQEGGNISELRDAILSVAALLLQLLQVVQELPAGQAGVNAAQLPIHLPPLTTAVMLVTFPRNLRCSKLTVSFC